MLADLAAGVSVVTGVTCYHLHFRRGNFLTGSVENSELTDVGVGLLFRYTVSERNVAVMRRFAHRDRLCFVALQIRKKPVMVAR